MFEISSPLPTIAILKGLEVPLRMLWDSASQAILVPGYVRAQRWARVGPNVSATTDFPSADKVCLSPTSTPHLDSSAGKVSWAPSSRSSAGASLHTEKHPALPPPPGGGCAMSVQAAHRRQRCSRAGLHPRCERHCRSLLPAEHTAAAPVLWGPWEKTLYQPPGQWAWNVLLQSVPSFLLPRGVKSAFSSWSYRLNICLAVSHTASAKCRSRSISKCYLRFLPVAKKLWTDSLTPSALSFLLFACHTRGCSALPQERRTPRRCLQRYWSSLPAKVTSTFKPGRLPRRRGLGLSIRHTFSFGVFP